MSTHRRLRARPLLPAFAMALAQLACASSAVSQTMQEHVHGHSHEVMPFDLGRTVHVFRMTEDGGTQEVILRKGAPDAGQIQLVQQHLRAEAERFRHGDFGDPARLHGPAMPGLRELELGASRISISYEPLPNGAAIRFHSTDPKLVTAIHRWFGAQLSEHGADARAE